jgi:hypothetical protein
LKIPISPGSKFRRLALFPLPLSPRINTGIPISHSSFFSALSGQNFPRSLNGFINHSSVMRQLYRLKFSSYRQNNLQYWHVACPSGKCTSISRLSDV